MLSGLNTISASQPAPGMATFNVVYHIATLNHWRNVVGEQLPILLGNRQMRRLVVTIASDDVETSKSAARLAHWYVHRSGHPIEFSVIPCRLADVEHPAMDLVDQLAAAEDLPILYFHTKAVRYPSPDPFFETWRQYLNRFVAGADGWAAFLSGSDFDACGRLLMTELKADGLSFFAGNFWMARASYLRLLPPYVQWIADPGHGFIPMDRFLAERAINRAGRMKPYVTDHIRFDDNTRDACMRHVLNHEFAMTSPHREPVAV